MQLPVRVVHAQPPAQCVERIALPRVALPSQLQRIEYGDAFAQRPVALAQPRKLGLQEAHVERRVVDHQLGAVDEGEKFVGDLGKARLVGQELQGQPGHFLRADLELAVRVEVFVEGAPGGPALDQLDAADLDHAVALLPFKAGGFGVEDDVAHGLQVPRVVVRCLGGSA
jgi:hypothetical protein